MNMVILKGSTMVNFYKNSGNFFFRRRMDTKISAFKRKMFELSKQMSFVVFWSFPTSLGALESANFIYFWNFDGNVFSKKN